jgi:hypothetical protein
MVPEPEDLRREKGPAKESRRQYSGAREHDEAQKQNSVDLKSLLLMCLEAGVFDSLIREALSTNPEEREALRRHLQRLCIKPPDGD